MHRELDAQRKFLDGSQVATLYFGGGTPSLLAPYQLQSLIDHAGQLFDISQVEEITMEANPDDLTLNYLEQLQDTDIDRLSIGIQSLNDSQLQFMNRRHTAQQAVEAVGNAQHMGFSNICVDLIFG